MIALIIGLVVTIVLPTGFFGLKFQNITGKVDAEAEINARLVTKLISENPDLWRYETYRLDELLSRRATKGNPEIRQILETNGTVIASHGPPLPLPTIMHDQPVIDGGTNVATLRIITTIQPLVIQTFLMFLLAMSLGAALFITLRILPFKAILKAEQALLESNEFLTKIMENDTNGILVVTPEERILLVNQAMVSISGYDRGALAVLKTFTVLMPESEKEHIRDQIRGLLLKHAPSFTFETSITRPDGDRRELSCGAAPIMKGDTVDAIVISLEDITTRKASEARIRQMAYFDTLTNLPNRALFNNEIEHAIAYAKRYHTTFGLMLIDIDNFKRVNDTLGHGYGDLLLQKVAERLVHCVRKSDYLSRPASEDTGEVVARLGGDEFTILLTSFNHEEDAAKVASRILEKTAQPYQLEEHEVFVTLSIGIATYPGDGTSQDVLFRNADTAMYHSKFLGKNTFQFYRAAMNEAAMQRLTLENYLFKALERNELQLYYQPQVSLKSGKIVGVEALLRWFQPELGMVSPLDFITIAEENGLIIPITEWVITEACRQTRAWQDEGLNPAKVAVNISPQVFKQRDLPALVATALQASQLEPGLLEVEITESLMLNNVEGIIKVLKEVRDMGVSISIDDFGTGYSSFSYLKQLPVHAIKIDRSFIKDLPDNLEDIAIVKAIIATAHSLGLGIIAEGVETREQREFLSWHDCDEFQGYLFSKPLSAADMRELLAKIDDTAEEA
jgi:diguanylate cyclase (GGDEF)-like protein/PAS domain S-box-containing protein